MTVLGSKKIVITGEDFAKGMTTSAYTQDGFFSTNVSNGINIATVPGVLYFQQPATDITPSSPGMFCAGCTGGGVNTALGYRNNYFITEGGKIYSYDGSTMNADITGLSKTYAYANTDIIFYKDFVYITSLTSTSDSDITRCTLNVGTNYRVASVIETWWSTTLGKGSMSGITRHPMIIFEDILWIADLNLIHKYDGTTGTAGFLTLASDQAITALGTDPGSGKMLIAVTQGPNASGSFPRVNKILVWDGYSNKVLRSIIVDEMVTAVYPVGGTIYMVYGMNLGYWNGSGIIFLRRLSKISAFQTDYLPYKHHITSVGKCLYVVDGTMVLAYESVKGGSPKVFYYAFGAPLTVSIANIGTIRTITPGGSENLLIAWKDGSTNYIQSLATRTVAQGTTADAAIGTRTKFFVFPVKVRIRMIRVLFSDPISTNKNPMTLQIYSDDTSFGAQRFNATNTLSGSTYKMDYKPDSQSTNEYDDFYLYFTDGNDSYSMGIRKVIIYYDEVE